MGWRSFLYGSCFHHSPAAEGWLLGCTLISFCSLDQTARDLLTAGYPRGSWQKQVRAHRRKCPLASTTHYSQAPGEAPSMHQNGSHAPGPTGQARSDLETDALHCSARDVTALASGALALALEAQVQGLFKQAEDSCRNDRLDQADGDE